MRRSREIRAIAVDYDRTLTDLELRLDGEAKRALARARAAGRRIVIVSGRSLAFLQRELGDVADALVAENGCFLHHEGRTRRLGPALDLAALDALGIEIERGEALLSVDVAHEARAREALRRAGVEADLVRNRDRVMALPRGVDKAVGVLAALEALGVAPDETVAIGDGENDVALLAAVGHAVAVANAVPELKAVADEVTPEIGGQGVAAWIERTRLATKEARAPW